MTDFDLSSTTFTIADYCGMLNRKEIRINREYQRSGKVWPPAARSFLIETILLGYPMPKLSLHQITDIKTRKTVREIVDGQQRTNAIKAFFDGELRLSRTIELDEASGKYYDDLSDELKSAFISYPVSVDIFTGASSDQIREVFRRINSYTVPLNPEEQRHATYQGEMKWFIYELSHEYDESMLRIGAFTQGRLVRMADAKLYAEITHALMHGITTTKSPNLKTLYSDSDKKFELRSEIKARFDLAIDLMLQMEDLHKSSLVKPHMLYSLLLALMHVQDPVPALQSVVEIAKRRKIDMSNAVPALSALGDALDVEQPAADFADFVAASESKTNVKDQRETRFVWLVQALLETDGEPW